MAGEPFRWGILGTGAIARKFAAGLAHAPGAVLAAVGSRSAAAAERFGAELGVPRRHAGYGALAADPELDAIYVCTPHSRHREDTLLCLDAGKPVVCEKPFALSRAQGEAMVERARSRGLFLMEGMWTRCHPVTRRVRELLAAGALGAPRLLQADFGFRAPWDPANRLFAPELGGGALLDVGVYAVSYARMVFGREPEAIAGLASLGASGVDEQSAWVFRYPGGELAVLSAAVSTETPQEALVCGTEGSLRVPRFWCPERYFLGEEEVVVELAGNGFQHEALHAMECIRAGRLESDLLPLDESLEILGTLDRIRAQWGLAYPGECPAAAAR